MLKFILFIIFISFVIRLVLRLLWGKVFSFRKSEFDRKKTQQSFTSGESADEADFEVIESHIHDDKRDIV